MAGWTINGKAPASLLVASSSSIRINNQDDDTAELTLTVGKSAALPADFADGAIVSIAYDGTYLLRGRVYPRNTDANPQSEYAGISIRGPWSDLREIPFRQTYVDPLTAASYDCGRIKLTGSLSAMVSSVISFAVSQGGYLQLGTIDLPTLTPPAVQATDPSCAAMLQQILKWVPGAQVIFDYSVSPPRCHVLRPTSSALTAVAAPAPAGAGYKLRSDLVPAAVKIVYERPYTISTRENLTANGYVTKSEAKQILVASDLSVGAGNTWGRRRSVMVTVTLSGTKQAAVTRHFTPINWASCGACEAFQNGYMPNIGYMLYLTGAKMVVTNNIYAPDTTHLYCRSYKCVNYPLNGVGELNDPNLMWFLPDRRDGAQMDSLIDKKLWSYPGLSLYQRRMESSWWTATSGGTNIVHTHNFVVCNYIGASPYNKTFEATEDATTDTLEAAPSGVAAAIMSAWGAALYEGKARTTVAGWSSMARVASVEGTKSPVQNVSISLGSDLVDLTFGPPAHLRPADFLELLNPSA